ncbi:MAG TPA: hypothetical protein VH415_17715 [Nitrososphaeraceae archaeon]
MIDRRSKLEETEERQSVSKEKGRGGDMVGLSVSSSPTLGSSKFRVEK